MRIISIGEILWDVFPDGEHLGGAPFNLAAHAARLGHRVNFISAVGDDPRGRRALSRAAALGLSTEYIRTVRAAGTGVVTVALDAAGRPAFEIHRPAAYDFAALEEQDLERLRVGRPNWICFGTLHQTHPGAKALTRRLIDAIPEARRFYDVNLRRHSYDAALVGELLGLAHVVKLNEEEMRELGAMLGLPCRVPAEFCDLSARRFGFEAVCVTRGELGCAALIRGQYVEAPGYQVQVVDTVGSGDAFAAAFLHGLGAGWPPEQVADFANRAGALVAGRPGATPEWRPEELAQLARR